MFRKRLTWFVSIVTTAMLAVMLLGVGGSQARTPGWTISAVAPDPSSTAVKQGAAAAWLVTITNVGKSNVSLVKLTTDIKASSGLQTPLYISDATWHNQTGPIRPCGSPPYSGALNCNFGNIISNDPDAFVTLVIAMPTPSSGSSYAFNFKATGNGNTLSDGGNSHGDTLLGFATVGLHDSSDPDFTGGFSLPGGDTFGTGTSLSSGNPQSSSVKSPNYFGINLTENSSFTDTGTNPCDANTCIGQWAHLNVGNGTEGPIKLTLLIRGNGIPGSISADDIGFYHTGDGIMTNGANGCPSATPTLAQMPCVTITKVGNNFQIVAWLLHNGSGRGMF